MPSAVLEERVTKVLPLWDNHVRFALDPLHNGSPYPGLGGQVYFFGRDEKKSIFASGQVVVDLSDVSGPPGTPERPCGRCVYDPTSLARMQKKGIVGDGYILFIDWPGYSPDISRVKVQLSFVPAQGAPIYADPTVISLHHDANLAAQFRQGQQAAAKSAVTPGVTTGATTPVAAPPSLAPGQ
jgi:hypothetical protein